jgi:polysaccharide export outer membrane protein
METLRRLCALSLACLLLGGLSSSWAQPMREVLGAGDTVRITVLRHPDLTAEVRISESGEMSVPLVGKLAVAGMTPEEASRRIVERLKAGQYLVNPQVDVAVLEARSRQVSVLGFVTRPGRYALEGATARVTDVLAMAGGVVPAASATAIVTRRNGGQSESHSVDLAAIIQRGDVSQDIEVGSGDSVFVPKAPVVYVYGEVARGGSYRLEPGMTVMQAISVAGGMTPRGSERRIKLRRREPGGEWREAAARPLDPVSADDVLYVREGLF